MWLEQKEKDESGGKGDRERSFHVSRNQGMEAVYFKCGGKPLNDS